LALSYYQALRRRDARSGSGLAPALASRINTPDV
jgi:hypothetical protein